MLKKNSPSRREILKWLAATMGAGISASCTQAALNFTSQDDHIVSTSELQVRVAQAFADVIIPETDTPSASQAGVGKFLRYAINTWYSETERQTLFTGINEIISMHSRSDGLAVLELSVSRKAQLLEALSESNPDAFVALRELVVVGYFTSRVGATQALHYLPMPGHYDGDYQVDEASRAWSS
ncbi:MAG: gluconate 2-dehydrogenase subunit 3 family protein [Pseudomonadota bacterium]